MIERLIAMVLPILFLIVLFGGGALFRRRNIDMDGDAPISRAPFYCSKYAIVVMWVAMALQSWGIGFSIFRAPSWLKLVSLTLWTAGFLLLFAGRLGLGRSFRIGSPKESTVLQAEGLFRLSRNPMYLGVYATVLAAALYTVNPVLLLLAIFIIAVHHRIVLAEEKYLRQAFGEAYAEYCRRVRRYL